MSTEKKKTLDKLTFLTQDEKNFKLTEVKDIPGFDPEMSLFMKPLTQSQRADVDDKLFANATTTADGSRKISSLKEYKQALVAASVVDPETREPMFTVEEVASMSAKVFAFLHEKATEVSGMNVEALEQAKGN